jgi:hypothetical protein
MEQDTNSAPDEESKETRGILSIILQKRLSELVFALLKRMLYASSKTSEGQNSLGSNQRLLTEEKVVFDFIEQLNDFYICDAEIQLAYIDFLSSFLDYNGDPRSDAFIRRVLHIMFSKMLTCKISAYLIKRVLPTILDRMQSLIELRYH